MLNLNYMRVETEIEIFVFDSNIMWRYLHVLILFLTWFYLNNQTTKKLNLDGKKINLAPHIDKVVLYAQNCPIMTKLDEIEELHQIREKNVSNRKFGQYEFNKFTNTRARILDAINHMTLRLLWNLIFAVKRYNFVIMYATLLWTSYCFP